MPNSSLLAQEEDTSAPSLSTAPVILEESALERLIAQSSTTPSSNIPFSLEEHVPSPSGGPRPIRQPTEMSTIRIITDGASLATVAAGSLSLLQIILVWGSLLVESWFETHLKVSVSWQKQYLPMLDDMTNLPIRSTSLASLFSTLAGSGQYEAFIGMVLTSLVIPCLCMVLCPVWIVGDHRERVSNQRQRNLFPIPRIIFELLIRMSFSVVFVMILLDLGTSSIELVGQDTDVVVYNRSLGGMVSYTLGMVCSLGVILILRVVQNLNFHLISSLSDNTPTTPSRRIPPARAFQLPWRNIPPPRESSQTEPLLEGENEYTQSTSDTNRMESMQLEPSTSHDRGLSMCQKFILCEVGILATLLWLPALFLPLFRISFKGLISEFMTKVSFQVRFWDLPAVVWHKGYLAGTEHWVLFSLCTFLILTVYILPLLATAVAIGIWSSGRKRLYRSLLICLHPTLCGIIFALAVVAVVPAFEPLGDFLLDEETSGLCTRFHETTAETCLTLAGQHALGGWFLLAQSISLELFVLLSISWSK